MMLDVTVHRPVVLSGIADAYGLQHPVELQHGTLQMPVLLGTIEQTLPIRKSCEHPVSGVTEVLDVWATVTPGSCRRQENEMLIPLKLSLCAFVRDTNGRPAFFDRTEELSCTIPVEAENPVCRDLVASVAEVSVALTGSTLDFTGSVLLTGCLYDRRRFDLLYGIETDESVRTAAPDTPLAMYFADEGESVWEIAKRFGAPTARICEENGLCGAVVAERCLLMIDRA